MKAKLAKTKKAKAKAKKPMPTEAEVQEQIKWLEANWKDVPKFSQLGDNQWDEIAAQLTVLKRKWSEEDILDNLDFGEEERDAALGARRWLDGQEPRSLSEEWSELIPEKKRRKE